MATLPPPSPLPEFVYKITRTAPPDPIPEQYPLSDLDRQDGFVHLSVSWQACPPSRTAPTTRMKQSRQTLTRETPAKLDPHHSRPLLQGHALLLHHQASPGQL
jgi:hypothetical protein